MITVAVTGSTDPTQRILHSPGDLPVNVLAVTDLMGVAVGSMRVSIPLTPRKRDRIEDARLTWRRLWWVLEDGHPIFVGIPTEHPQFDHRANALTCTLPRADVILTRRRFWSTLVFRDVDQHHIAGDLIRYGTGRPVEHVHSDYAPHVGILPGAFLPWLRVAESPSGVLRTREDNDHGYQGGVGKPVSDALRELSAVEDAGPKLREPQGISGAFDIVLEYGRDPDGTLFAEYVLGYPKVGRADPLYAAYPGPVSGFVEAVDSTDTATAWRTVSTATDARLPGEPQYDTDAFSQQWPLLQGQDSSSATDDATLRDHAAAQLRRFTGENRGWRYELDTDQWGKFGRGDIIRPAIRFEARWPGVQSPPAQRVQGYDLAYSGGVLTKLSPILADLR